MTAGDELPRSTHDGKSSSFWPTVGVLLLVALLVRLLVGPPAVKAGAAMPPLEASGWLNSHQPLTPEGLRGNVVLMDCWASWCLPCVANMPALIELKDRYRDYDLTVLGLTPEDGGELASLTQYVDSVPGLSWPIAYGAGPALEAMGVSAFPTLIVFDRQGQVVWSGHDLQSAEEAIAKALARPS